MLNLEELKTEQLYNWKKKYMLQIDEIEEIAKKEAPKAYESKEFQQSIKDLKDGLEQYCIQKEKDIRDLTNDT
ncbi:MAG: hypothetical protein J6A04_04710 [Clostridia bacterium]|nr:hypothetical protein [Clostridia bacterium]